MFFPFLRSGLIIKNQKRVSSVEEAISYFDLMASYLDELRKIQNLVREKIGYQFNFQVLFIRISLEQSADFSIGLFFRLFLCSDDVNSNITNAKYSTYIGIAILAVVLVVSPVIIFLVRNATNTIQVGGFLFHFIRFYLVTANDIAAIIYVYSFLVCSLSLSLCFLFGLDFSSSFFFGLDLRVQFVGKSERTKTRET